MSSDNNNNKSDVSIESGMYDSIIVLLDKCNAEECDRIVAAAVARRNELNGKVPTISDTVKELLSGCTNVSDLEAVVEIAKSEMKKVVKKTETPSEKATRKYLEKELKRILKECDRSIEDFIENPALEKVITKVHDEKIRQLVRDHYGAKGHNTSSYKDGEIKVKLSEMTPEMITQEMEKLDPPRKK